MKKGERMSDEQRAKISAAHKGVPLSAEHRAAISAVQTGRRQSAETVAKRVAKLIGRKHPPRSAEWRVKQSAARKGRKPWNTGKPMLDATRAKVSAAKVGQPLSHGHTTYGQPVSSGRGRGRSGTYNSWAHMIQRCTNPKCLHWPYYGGRQPNPVTVFPAWRVFENFLAYLKASGLGERPAGLTLDRIDPEGSYVPGNVRWATRAEQTNNTRRQKARAAA